MKVFICWSGERGLKFATACQTWLRGVVGDVLVPALSVDIEKGGLWFDDLTEALREARVGIICLTPEGTASPWIHFEAGILAKTLEADSAATGQPSSALRTFPLLFGIGPSALNGPLAAFQATSSTDRDDCWRLIESILALMSDDERPDRKEVNKRFKTHWKDLQRTLRQSEPAKFTDLLPDFEGLFRRKTFDESMYDCLTQGWLERFSGAHDVQRLLQESSGTVRAVCRPFVADVFDALIAQLNAYTMCLSVLIGRPTFPIDDDGKVIFDHRGIAEAAERRRRTIKSLVARLADERQAPVFDEAFRYAEAETFAERKRLIHRKTAEIREDLDAIAVLMKSATPGRFGSSTIGERCKTSDWDFDRIMHNVWLEEWPDALEVDDQLTTVRLELEKAAAADGTPGLTPLHYSLGPLRKALSMAPFSLAAPHVRSVLKEIRDFIEAKRADRGGQLRRTLAEIENLTVSNDAPVQLA